MYRLIGAQLRRIWSQLGVSVRHLGLKRGTINVKSHYFSFVFFMF